MRVIDRRKVEDCLDGGAVFEYEISEPWTAESVRVLEPLGKLEYFAGFPRPLFRLRTQDGVLVTGVTGDTVCRVVLPAANRAAAQKRIDDSFT
jgi:hypothetical protein